MPIYEYSCQKCAARVEVMQKIADKPLKRCEKCGGKLEKEWSSTSFQFKGSGWYVTDYAGKKADAAEKESAKSENKSENAAETKTETVAETKTEPAAEVKDSKTKKTPQPATTSKTTKSE